ncbi:hypothetical protein acdb102_09830 [Acidothermaceae bacterium B102]|nr:hypothetical protein acdb102_09830 [Acidothermaceae bacterium B102]
MRVGYDEQVFLAQQRGGISRYVVSLVRALQADTSLDIEPVPGWAYSTNVHSNDVGLSRRIALLDRLPGPELAHQVGYLLANTSSRRRARRAEVLHHTYFHPRFWAPGSKAAHVCTVYDMIPELFPESFPGRNPHLAKESYVQRCDVVFCISESAKSDLISLYGDPGVPMPVTYLGVGPEFRPGLPRPAAVPDRYLLFVGKRGGYKDFGVLAEAFAELNDPSVSLLAVGGGGFTDDETRDLDRLGIAGRVRQLAVTDETLPAVYGHALAFVFPSRHEGFGLPTLEAMASGTAAVLADSSSHPEVGGDVARYFPVSDVAALSTVLDELVGDDNLRAALSEAGIARAATFTWGATARETAVAYRTLATD